MVPAQGMKSIRTTRNDSAEVASIAYPTSSEAVQLGVAGYLLKSLDADELFDLLSGVTRGEPAMTRAMASKLLKSVASRMADPGKGEQSLTERELFVLRLVASGASNLEIDIYRSRFRPLKHTLTGRDERTMMKLVVDRSTDQVLGCHMVGTDAGEITQGLAIALNCGATKAQFDATIGIHPTAAEEFVTMRTKVID